jgi:hypothetical protein
MKILVITTHFRSKNQYGGQRTRHMCRQFSLLGHSVDVVVPRYDPLTSEKNTSVSLSNSRIKKITLFSFINNRSFILTRLVYMASYAVSSFFYLVRSVKRYDCVVLNTMPPLTYVLCGLYMAIFKKAYICDVRDMPFHNIIDIYNRYSILLPLFNLALKVHNYIIKRSIMVIAVTQGMANETLKYNDRTYVIPLGSDYETTRIVGRVKNDNLIKLVYIGSVNNFFCLDSFCEVIEAQEGKDNRIELDIYGIKTNLIMGIVNKYKFCNYRGVKSKFELTSLVNQYHYGVFPLCNFSSAQWILGNKFYDYLDLNIPILSYSNSKSDVSKTINKFNIGVNIPYSGHRSNMVDDLIKNHEVYYKSLCECKRVYTRKAIDEMLCNFGVDMATIIKEDL